MCSVNEGAQESNSERFLGGETVRAREVGVRVVKKRPGGQDGKPSEFLDELEVSEGLLRPLASAAGSQLPSAVGRKAQMERSSAGRSQPSWAWRAPLPLPKVCHIPFSELGRGVSQPSS